MTIYILLFIINILCGWVFLLKEEENIQHTATPKSSITNTNLTGVIFVLVFGFVLLSQMIIRHGLTYFAYRIKD